MSDVYVAKPAPRQDNVKSQGGAASAIDPADPSANRVFQASAVASKKAGAIASDASETGSGVMQGLEADQDLKISMLQSQIELGIRQLASPAFNFSHEQREEKIQKLAEYAGELMETRLHLSSGQVQSVLDSLSALKNKWSGADLEYQGLGIKQGSSPNGSMQISAADSREYRYSLLGLKRAMAEEGLSASQAETLSAEIAPFFEDLDVKILHALTEEYSGKIAPDGIEKEIRYLKTRDLDREKRDLYLRIGNTREHSESLTIHSASALDKLPATREESFRQEQASEEAALWLHYEFEAPVPANIAHDIVVTLEEIGRSRLGL